MVTEILRELEPTPAGYARAAGRIEAGDFDSLAPMNVGVLATFTFDLLKPYLIVEGARARLLPVITARIPYWKRNWPFSLTW